MFIAHSASRTRLVRLLFFALAVGPVAAVSGWATWVRSAAHRRATERAWERGLGVPVRMAGLIHVRPGAVRAVSCRLAAADGSAGLEIPEAELEATTSALRVRIARIRCDPAAARLLAGVAADWLGRGPGWMQDCVVEIDDFAWVATPEPSDIRSPPTAGSASLRIECVATAEGRAVRVVLRPEGHASQSEVRIMRSPADFPPLASGAAPRTEVVGTWTEPLPLPVLAGLVSSPPPRLGPEATATGRLDLWRDPQGWHGTITGQISGIDLAACGDALRVAAAGAATIEIRSLNLVAGRIEACELACQAGRGMVARSFLDALVSQLGCRPGIGTPAGSSGGPCGFDQAGALVRAHRGEIELLPPPRLGGALAIGAGGALLWPPPGPVPAMQLAWLFAPPGTPSLPAAGPGAWLMSLLPGGGVGSSAGDPGRVSAGPAVPGASPPGRPLRR